MYGYFYAEDFYFSNALVCIVTAFYRFYCIILNFTESALHVSIAYLPFNLLHALHDEERYVSVISCLWLCILRINVHASQIVTRGQFWPSGIVVACVCLSVCVSVCVCVRQPRACPRHKSRRVQARTTKFGQKVQNNLVKVPIVLGGDWPWPSRSNLTWKAKFTPFWACPCHNS